VECASEPILRQAVVQFLEQNVFKGRTILQSAASNPDLGALYGLLFERFVHHVVASVSTSSPYRSLENEIGLGSLELPCMPCHLFRSIDEIKMNCYNQPIVSNFEGIDSLVPSLGIVSKRQRRRNMS
jgi:hypothetical protein